MKHGSLRKLKSNRWTSGLFSLTHVCWLQGQAMVDDVDNLGQTALMVAVFSGETDCHRQCNTFDRYAPPHVMLYLQIVRKQLKS